MAPASHDECPRDGVVAVAAALRVLALATAARPQCASPSASSSHHVVLQADPPHCKLGACKGDAFPSQAFATCRGPSSSTAWVGQFARRVRLSEWLEELDRRDQRWAALRHNCRLWEWQLPPQVCFHLADLSALLVNREQQLSVASLRNPYIMICRRGDGLPNLAGVLTSVRATSVRPHCHRRGCVRLDIFSLTFERRQIRQPRDI